MINIGVISDTHKLLRPEAVAALQGSDIIIHAGDIGSQDILSGLEMIAPVRAVRGNIDKGSWADDYPTEDVVEVAGRYIYVLHNLSDINLDPGAAGFDVVVSGHSHKPNSEERNGVLYLNPGSAGPKRFSLPVTLAKLEINSKRVFAQIHKLVT